MTSDIRVKVSRNGSRKYFLMYYDDPDTGKRKQRSTKATRKREAEREAGKWEAELREGRYCPSSNISWEEFRELYEAEHLASLADQTGDLVRSVFRTVERILNPKRLRDLTESRLSYFQSQLRDGTRSEATICGYLRHLKSALGWAAKIKKLIPSVPAIQMPKRAKGSKMMKGRPIALQEFNEMLAKTESVVGREAAPQWVCFLRGLWLSGLRLGEAMELWWDREDKLGVVLDGRKSMFKIRAELEKGNQDRLLPMAPDFFEFLDRTPEELRTGPVFPLTGRSGRGECRDLDWASKIICDIGKAAGIEVGVRRARGKKKDKASGKANGKPKMQVKYASAHDLRRSFGARWAIKVMPVVLQQLMRHDSIETTLRYYVGQNAEATADAIWDAMERESKPVSTFVSTPRKMDDSQNGQNSQPLADNRLS